MRIAVRMPQHPLFDKLKQAGWKKISIIAGLSLIGLLLLVQLFYPTDRLPLAASIDGQQLGGNTKAEAATVLDAAYSAHKVAIYMGSGKEPVVSPRFSDMDVSVNNAARLEKASYPWYMRLVPTSLFWANVTNVPTPSAQFGSKFTSYIDTKLMPDCKQAPVDATLKVNGEKLNLVPAITGGTCEKSDVIASIKKVTPSLTQKTSVRVARDEQAPTVSDAAATEYARTLTMRLKDGVTIDVLGGPVVVDTKDALSWLDFSTKDGAIAANVSGEKAGAWLNEHVAAKVAVAPGVSYITTLDFTETARVNGGSGRALDVGATVASIQSVVAGDATQANAATIVVAPTEQYTRTYSASDKGLSALLANYAKDHPGTYGISLVELEGKKRRADYNGDKQFVTASTYKLFVAYSLLKQIDAGKRSWDSDSACFNKMISLSDNACAEGFLNALGLNNVTKDIQGIGLKNSTFMKSGGPFTTANDLTLMLGMIATSQNFSAVNQQRLIAAMKANVYRKGIPAGVAGTVADKVGFLDGLLHDAAIVYGPHGTYVLAIMTDGSSWATIADLAKQIDTLHAQ